MTEINKRFNDAISDVVTEAMSGHWKRALEARQEIASMLKSSGLGKQLYYAVFENLEIAIRQAGGEKLILDFSHAIQHKAHYMSESVIILPRPKLI